MRFAALFLVGLSVGGCLSGAPEGLAPASPADTRVKYDFYHRPLPDIPLPNDIATRYDASSPTGRRLNASMLASTHLERRVREKIDQLDGWGLFMPISIPFDGEIDVTSLLERHRDVDYDMADDAIYLINLDADSPEHGQAVPIDLGEGNYPVVLEKLDYYKNDPRGWLNSLMFEETNEDLDGDGVLDPGGDADGDGVLGPGEWPEDTDADGVLDVANYLPGKSPAVDDLAGRADALMTFYERETHTVIARPLVPLRERTTYAVVVTRRLLDASGKPVGSPFPFINHEGQTQALRGLPDYLPQGLGLEDIAFTFSFTTQSVEAEWIAVRDGLYGHGVQGHLGTEFPAELNQLLTAIDADQGAQNPYILPMQQLAPLLGPLLSEVVGTDTSGKTFELLSATADYVDYTTQGSFLSPQLFSRTDASGALLPYDDQSWPPDLARVPAKAVAETVYYSLYVPRKEISARGEGKPAPVVILGHGYTSSRFESLNWAPYLAKFGIATIAIDCPSHGSVASEAEKEQAYQILGIFGLGAYIEASLLSRAFDQNADGAADTGADFWTSHLFHTRDMVRQCTLDTMQLIRIIRSFDGKRLGPADVDGDGDIDLAGDFDGDGAIDIGGDALIGLTGSSLGGMTSSMLAALEPEVQAAAPNCGGGGLTDVANRSTQGGVREAVQLRLMAPIYVGTIDAAGALVLETIVSNLNGAQEIKLATANGVKPGDTVRVENLSAGEVGCAFVSQTGTFRTAVRSDLGDRTRVALYRGPVLVPGTECGVKAGEVPYLAIDEFGESIDFQGERHFPGEPLVALAAGLAVRRGTPEFRRLLSLGQLVLDPADPAVVARHLSSEPLVYPGTGQATGTHTLIVTTVGDMNVPANAGVSQGRAAGFIDYLKADPRYGKPPNQVLLDTRMVEAVHSLGRYQDKDGNPVHIDVENFSAGTDYYAAHGIPRLDPPLRLTGEDPLCDLGPEACGFSGSLFPYALDTGKHDVPLPGEWTQAARNECKTTCTTDCAACDELETFDMGLFMYGVTARYLGSGGKTLDFDPCNAFDTCPDVPPPPP
jgi:dienelactone hydrolase